jgi:hypothetical protein
VSATYLAAFVFDGGDDGILDALLRRPTLPVR